MALITPYQSVWPSWFEALRDHLGFALDGDHLAIEHVGSTSIPGMSAKPIIDIDVVIEPGSLSKVVRRLADAGYDHQGDLWLPRQAVFQFL